MIHPSLAQWNLLIRNEANVLHSILQTIFSYLALLLKRSIISIQYLVIYEDLSTKPHLLEKIMDASTKHLRSKLI